MRTRFTSKEIEAFEPESKVGLLATVDPDGLPHVTLITSITTCGETQLTWGQFCEGLSKQHVHQNPRVGFLIMTLDRRVWRGQARWTGVATSGQDYERFNRKPMFRYNAYFGIHTVHFMDLVGVDGPAGLPLVGFAAGTVSTLLQSHLRRHADGARVLKPWAQGFLSRPDSLKFLCWVAPDGYPRLVPLVPAVPDDHGRILFAPTVHRQELQTLPRGLEVALYALNLKMENIMVRGTFTGYRPQLGLPVGTLDLNYVYNSMPPKMGPIYPPRPVTTVTEF